MELGECLVRSEDLSYGIRLIDSGRNHARPSFRGGGGLRPRRAGRGATIGRRMMKTERLGLIAAGVLLSAGFLVTPCAAMPAVKLSAVPGHTSTHVRHVARGCGPFRCWWYRAPRPGYRGGWWDGCGPAWEEYGPAWYGWPGPE